jgi:hypothetical protein
MVLNDQERLRTNGQKMVTVWSRFGHGNVHKMKDQLYTNILFNIQITYTYDSVCIQSS